MLSDIMTLLLEETNLILEDSPYSFTDFELGYTLASFLDSFSTRRISYMLEPLVGILTGLVKFSS